jgi:methylthioribose-1-phosphate isomerase
LHVECQQTSGQYRARGASLHGRCDQTLLPHHVQIKTLCNESEVVDAIKTMVVRGAPLIGITAAFGMALGLHADASDIAMQSTHARLLASRPTAVNLRYALEQVDAAVAYLPPAHRAQAAWELACKMLDDEVVLCRRMGEHGAKLLAQLHHKNPNRPVRVLTHCNAGWLATVQHGTALAPLYEAQRQGIPLEIWVDETRPRNQGASLTAWELSQAGIELTVIADNAGGHLMQHGQVDICFVGADRVSRQGDVCNKIGTYLKALAAHHNQVPFYAVLPLSTVDWQLQDGVSGTPIEERDAGEVTHMTGWDEEANTLRKVRVVPQGVRALNVGFDVTPRNLMTGLITEHGICEASVAGLQSMRALQY